MKTIGVCTGALLFCLTILSWGEDLNSLRLKMQQESENSVSPSDSLLDLALIRAKHKREAYKAGSLAEIDTLSNFSTQEKDQIKLVFQELFPLGK